jgi:hypothetical protein
MSIPRAFLVAAACILIAGCRQDSPTATPAPEARHAPPTAVPTEEMVSPAATLGATSTRGSGGAWSSRCTPLGWMASGSTAPR